MTKRRRGCNEYGLPIKYFDGLQPRKRFNGKIALPVGFKSWKEYSKDCRVSVAIPLTPQERRDNLV